MSKVNGFGRIFFYCMIPIGIYSFVFGVDLKVRIAAVLSICLSVIAAAIVSSIDTVTGRSR